MGLSIFQPSTLGMKSQAHALNTIGSNISNVNTPGYKRTITRFSTVLSNNLRTGAGSHTSKSFANQERAMGGVLPKDYQTLDQQGILTGTDRDLDLAIAGQGFFQISPTLTTNNEIFFTRDGGFQVNIAGAKIPVVAQDGNTIQADQGYLTDKNGYFLLGVSPAADGTFSPTGALAPMRVDQYAFPNNFSATTTAEMQLNLPAATLLTGSTEATAIPIIDSNGLQRSLTARFTKTPTVNQWQLDFTAENLTSATQAPGAAFTLTTGIGSGKLMQLDPSSRSISIKNELIPTAFSPGAFLGLKVGDSITLSGTTAANGTYTIGAISSDSATITVDAGTPLPGGPETVGPVQQVDNITVGAPVEIGDKFTVTLNGVAFNFTATTTSANDVATGMAAAINGGTEPVTAGSASGGGFSLTADTAGTAFTSAVTTTETDGSATNGQTIATATATANVSGGSLVSATSTRVVGSPLIFNSNGQLASTTAPTVSLAWGDGATNAITFDFNTVTQFNGAFVLSDFAQNGLASADIKSVSFDGKGHVVGSFSDGSSRIIYKVPLAMFTNVNGLEALSGNVYGESPESGTRRSVFSDTSGVAVLAPNTLELSNVDLTTQFTMMIQMQQAYNSSATVFKTVDELLVTARDLKR